MENIRFVDELLEIEWDMFKNVNNVGGKAFCQNDYTTFSIMRKSQYLAWNEAIRESYLNDLKTAKSEQRNLLAEKYARMMYYTHKDDYDNIKHQLPTVTDETYSLIDELANIHHNMEVAFREKFPNIRSRGRDTEKGTTANIYLKGELATYSPTTLNLIKEYVCSLEKENKNIIEDIHLYTVKFYGYNSLEEVENRK